MLQQKLEQLGAAFAGVTTNCYHYFRNTKAMPCIVWAEEAEEGSFSSDNRKTEQHIVGTVHAYTRTEFDPMLDSVQAVLDRLGVGWNLESVQFEETTNLIHYTWRWGVAFYGEAEA